MKKPNFFIVGAPKCGTTALSEYLREHPGVFFTERKELNYFNTDFSEAYRIRFGARKLLQGENDYLLQFKNANNKHKAIGEGTVWYMYSQEAVKRIRAFNKGAKIIVMLRNPVDMAYSLHGQMILSFNENIEDFETAWKSQETRKRGKGIPRTCLDPKLLQYQDICMLGSQLERIYRIFPKDHVLAILFDDFVVHTREVFEDVLAFLDLEPEKRLYFPRVNVYETHRLKFINRLLFGRSPLWFIKSQETIKRLIKIESLSIYPFLRNIMFKDKRKPLDPAIRRMVIDVFSQDIDRLGSLLDVDLNHWKGQH